MDTPSPEPSDAVNPVPKPALRIKTPSAALPVVEPSAASEPQDPTWWRLGSVPFIVLILAAAGLDLAWPVLCGGIGAGIGCALWCLAILLLRRDFSKGETWFLGALALITLVALGVSGNVLNWASAFALPLALVLIPKPQAVTSTRYHNWWGYWFARRKVVAQGRWAWLRQILPTLITVFVGVALFIVFLIIFASGNPVVLLVWETICDWWNRLVEWLELDWDFVGHAALWLLAFFLFGIYTFARPAEPKPLPALPAAVVKSGRSLLPHLPLASLIGINLAFLIATGTDIAYLWFGRAPEGVSQTTYLHDGAASITWAAVLASAILIFLFRPTGSARQGRCTRVAGYLLVLQTFLLAVSVYVRLYHQVGDFGFTPRRIQAAEALLLGLDGLVILICYMSCSGSFWKYTRICLGSMLLIFIAFGICPPAELAGNLNLRYAATHPHWKFTLADFKPGCFMVEDNLAFALYVQQHQLPAENEHFGLRLQNAAQRLEWKTKGALDGWTHWSLSLQRDIPAAEAILGHPIEVKEVETEQSH